MSLLCREETWKEHKLNFLEHRYGHLISKWENESDDRKVLVNTYRLIVNGINSLPDNPDLYVRNAMNRDIVEDCRMMDRIVSNFKGVRE